MVDNNIAERTQILIQNCDELVCRNQFAEGRKTFYVAEKRGYVLVAPAERKEFRIFFKLLYDIF